jgi:hypothetical protein
MGFFQGLGTKLNHLRHIGGKVLGAAAKIGIKFGGLAQIAGPIIAASGNPMVGQAIASTGRIVSGLGTAAGRIKSGAADDRNVAGGINDLKAMRGAPAMVA